jgi:hypothetical protein
MTKPSTDTIVASKSPRGRKLMGALMKELHRRGVSPVQGEIRNEMRRFVAAKIAADENESGAPQGVVSWARGVVGKLERQ